MFFLTLPFLHTRAHAPPPHTRMDFFHFYYHFLDKAFGKRLLPDPVAHDNGVITELPVNVAVGITSGETGNEAGMLV